MSEGVDLGKDIYILKGPNTGRIRDKQLAHEAANRVYTDINVLTEPEDLFGKKTTELNSQEKEILANEQKRIFYKLSDNEKIIASARHTVDDERQLKKTKKELTIDELTGLVNKKEFQRRVKQEMNLIDRSLYGVLTVIMMDLDNFKLVNDKFGHNTGDEALKLFAEILRENTRSYDIPSRLSGDEFAILEINGPSDSFKLIRKRVETKLDELKNDPKYSAWLKLTNVSMGVAQYHKGDNITPEELMGRADDAMYHAKKQSGTSSVVWYQDMDKRPL